MEGCELFYNSLTNMMVVGQHDGQMKIFSFQAAKRTASEKMELAKLLDFKGKEVHTEKVTQVRWIRHFYG